MRPAVFPEADLFRRREAFLDLVARARLAPPAQRERFLAAAAMVAQLHQEVTGAPLLPDVAGHLSAAGRNAVPLRA
jgi:hypothetical protein